MASLKDVNEKLDLTLILFFETVADLHNEQEKLNDKMKEGFLNMSRARYSMGVKSVSIDQIHEENMTATTKIAVQKDLDIEKEDLFSVCCESEETSEIETLGIRKRNTCKDQEESSREKGIEKVKTDPIKWFGVLVPQSLRQCQSQFKSSLENMVTIANLKQKLLKIKKEYKDLQNEKQKYQ